MRKIFLLLLLTLPLASYSQQRYRTIIPLLNSSPPIDSVFTISFSNPQDTVCKVWRSGVEYTGTINTKTGQTVTKWSIIEHLSRDTVASGTGTSVTATMTFVHIDSTVFDLYAIMAGLGGDTLMLPAEIFTLPQIPVSYDETWSTATGHGMGWTDRAGYAIRVTGTISGHLNHWWLKSDDPTDPVHVVFDNATINSSTWNFTATASKNVIYDGCANDNQGLVAVKTGSGLNQIIQFTMAEPNNATYRGGSTIWCGIYADGADIAGAGNTGMRIIPPNDATTNDTNFSLSYILQNHITIRGTHEEGAYNGATNDTQTSGRTYSRMDQAYFYHWNIDSTGNEAFQIGSADKWEFARSRLSNSGLRGQEFHENLLQVGYSSNGDVYMNFMDQGAAHNTIAWFPGRTGLDNEFHANVIYSLGQGTSGNLWGRTDNHDTETSKQYSFWNNTIQTTTGTAFTLYETVDIWDKFNAVGNIIIGQNTTDFTNGSGFDSGHTVFDNLKYLTANIGSVGFVDYANKNYHLSSLASPAFATPSSITKNSMFKDYDFEGVKFITPVFGAYSGYELIKN